MSASWLAVARRVPALVVAVVSLASAGAAATVETGLQASQQTPAGRPGRGPLGEGPTPAEVQRLFDQFEMVQAQRSLDMTDEEFAMVGARLLRMQTMRRRHEVQRRTILRNLRVAIDSGAVESDEAGVTAMLAEFNGLGVRQAQEMRRAQQAIDSVLTVRQRAAFRLFQERFERQKLDLLIRVRQGRIGPPPGR